MKDQGFRPLPTLQLLCLTGLLWLGLVPSVAAASSLRHPQFMKKVEAGFDYIYNLDYQGARDSFEALKQEYPDHPAPPLYIATAIWLRELFTRQELDIENFIAPGYFDKPTSRRMPEKDRKEFFEHIEESQRLAEAVLEQYPGEPDARYFQGSALGVLASFSITIDRSKSDAFSYGKKAYRLHHELVEENRDYYDAYMSVGLYEYIVGNLPWYIKWLAAIVGYRGSVERGFEYLTLAAQKGEFVSDDARTLQMVLFVREKRYREALQNVQHLEKRAPRSFLLQLNKAQILEKLGRREEAARTYASVVDRAARKVPNFQLLPLKTMRYRVGKKLFELGRPDDALTLLEQSRQNPETPPREKALSTLVAAEILDQKGRHQEARQYYESVLQQPDFDNSHKRARRHLKKL